MLCSPAALCIPNAWFLRGWQGCLLLLPPPHSHLCLIHYLWRIGTRRPRNTHSPHFYFLLGHTNISELLTILTAVSPRDLRVSAAPNLCPLSPQHHGANPVPLSVAGQQGSWGCRRPRLLFRAAEADMGKEVSNGIGRLSLIDFTSRILLRHNHHGLRNKYVSCLFLFGKHSQGRGWMLSV